MTKIKQVKSKLKKNEDFIPPDGGWGWIIVLAAGISNLSMLPVLQQFGLLFREKFARLGMTNAQTTTLVNMHTTMCSVVGLANGPVFRTFSYRQVSLTGAILGFTALLLTTFSYNFATYFVAFSLLYGSSYGISSSGNALALNVYWKNRRRLATGLTWTITGLGPIIWPQIINVMFSNVGETGTVLILSGVALHAVVCGLLLQPVEWHEKKSNKKDETLDKSLESKPKDPQIVNEKQSNGYFSHTSMFKNLSAFSSQYLFNEDDPINPGYEITDPGIPMMLRSNDGYFSQSRQSKSKISSREGSNRNSQLNSRLHSKGPSTTNLLENRSRKSSMLYLNESKKNSTANLGSLVQERDNYKPKRKTSITLETQIPESEIEDCPTLKAPQDLKADEKVIVEKINPFQAKVIADKAEKHFKDGKRLKSFSSMEENEKYNKDNHSNVSLKPQDEKHFKDGKRLKSFSSMEENEKYNKDNHSNVSFKHQDQENEDRKYLRDNHSNQSYRTKNRRKSNNFNYESELLKQASVKLEQYLKESDDNPDKMRLLPQIDDNGNKKVIIENEDNIFDNNEEEKELTFSQKFTLFFDLDLLKDYTFVNLMLGMTVANFNETNFSILTPFFLGDFGIPKSEVALFMSILGGVDVCVRFCVPFVAGKIGWHNNSFYLLGVCTMAMGRVVLAHWQTYNVVMLVAVIIGFGKGLRTVFMALVIPTHVPLYKLPGATGIQLVTAAIVSATFGPVVVLAHWQTYNVVMLVAVIIGFGKGLRTVFMALVIPTHVPLYKLPGATGIQLVTAAIVSATFGPVVGWIQSNTSTAVTLYCLNIFTVLTAISWGTEKYITSRRQKAEQELVKA